MKYIKSLRMLAAALTIVLLAAAIPATPALAQTRLFAQPTSGKIGDSINVYGYGFTPGASLYVYFSSKQAVVSDYLDVAVTAYEQVQVATTGDAAETSGEINTYFAVPDRLTDGSQEERVSNGTYYIYVTYSAKRILAAVNFAVVSVSNISLSQNSGMAGTEVAITGNGFGNQESITIKYDGNTVRIQSGAQVTDIDGSFSSTIVIPQSITGSHTISVTGDISHNEARVEFTVEPEITIVPTSGDAGDNITLSGTGFGRSLNLSISFGAVKIATNEKTDSNGSFGTTFAALPRGAGSYYIEARDDNGNLDTVNFILAPPAINLSPTTGNIGSQVTISGTGLKTNRSVQISFDNDLIETTSTDNYGRFTTSFDVPPRVAGTYILKVTDGVNTIGAAFTIIISASISPVTSALSPGHVGTELTISGAGFTSGGIVTITYDSNQVAMATANTSGLFSATFKAPASVGGEHKIIATDGVNTKQVTFIMESTPPPAPVPLKPEAGVKTKTQTSFGWEDVTDPSGVTYILQIATDKNFSNDSMVLQKTGLTESEYTLTREESLKSAGKENPYYWQVKAVDGASNSSQWSSTGSFYVGFTWGTTQLVYVMIGIGVVFLILLSYWLGMKKARH